MFIKYTFNFKLVVIFLFIISGLTRKGVKIPKHVDVENPHSFEIDDLKKLILTVSHCFSLLLFRFDSLISI